MTQEPVPHPGMQLLNVLPDSPLLEAAKALMVEYEASLGVSLCFQGFQQELANLPGVYGPPQGCLLLANLNDEAVGCIALRPLEPGICEMKRLYVKPAARGLGLGRVLVTRLIREAECRGYSLMRLDTLTRLTAAIKLYESLAFTPCAPYGDHALPGTLYFARVLAPQSQE